MDSIWGKRITEIFERYDIDPTKSTDNPDIMDGVARMLGFKDTKDMARFPSEKDIINGVASPLEPHDRIREFDLLTNVIALIHHEWKLFKNEFKTIDQLSNFFRYANKNFHEDNLVIIFAIIYRDFRTEDGKPYDFVDLENDDLQLQSYVKLSVTGLKYLEELQ